MYHELQLFEESFDHHPVWGTEGNDLPLPTLAVGDLFEHDSLPAIHWRTPPEPGQVFKVIAIKHVFSETGPGPEANHLLMVAVALGDLESRQEAALDEAESALENQTRRGDFLSVLLRDLAQHTAPEVRDKLVQGIVSAMKGMSAHGIEDEAESAWEEAAMILQANDHLLADMLQGEIQADVRRAIAQLDREDRLTLWLADAELDDWFPDDWPDAQTALDPLTRWREAMDAAEQQMTQRVLTLLYAHEFPV